MRLNFHFWHSLVVRFNEKEGAHEHDQIIDEGVDVHPPRHCRHHVILNLVQLLRIILETESLVLIVYARFEKPVRQARFLPAFERHTVVDEQFLTDFFG